jgi:hypothetical protein
MVKTTTTCRDCGGRIEIVHGRPRQALEVRQDLAAQVVYKWQD